MLVGESITSNDSLDYVEVENATQVALRMGRSIPNRTHPDHFKLSFTNVVLGGYFGSRLMQNIREDKGFTYGIGSNSVHFKQAGFLTISCNIKADCLEQTIEECYKEMRLLAKDLIPEGEFVRVKNYLIGDIQRQMDGPFALADTFKSLLFHQEDFNYIHQMIEAIHKITRRDIADMAAKYLEPLDYICIAAGPAKK